MPVDAVTAELLVRYLDTWVPAALHSAKRATFVQTSPRAIDIGEAESVLRVFGEFGDRMRSRRVAVVFIAPEVGDAARRLTGVAADFAVHVLAGSAATHVGAAIAAAQAAGGPLLARVDTDEDPTEAVRAAAAGKPAEILLHLPTGTHAKVVSELHAARFPLVSAIELVSDDAARLIVFGTSSAKSLEAFKNELWQLDEYAGVRIRDPYDADGHLMDISLRPHPGPLRREILAFLRNHGEATVTEVRRFALTETAYRVSDVNAVLGALISGGTVIRRPEHGRLGGDTVVDLPAAVRAELRKPRGE